MKGAFKKPTYRKMSEREFVDSIGHSLRLQGPQLLDLLSGGRSAEALHEDSGAIQR